MSGGAGVLRIESTSWNVGVSKGSMFSAANDCCNSTDFPCTLNRVTVCFSDLTAGVLSVEILKYYMSLSLTKIHPWKVSETSSFLHIRGLSQ